MDRMSSLMTLTTSATTPIASWATFISSGDKSFPKSSSLSSSSDISLPCGWPSPLSGSDTSLVGSDEDGSSSFISRKTSLMETATRVISRPIAVIFVAGVFLRAEHASQTEPTNGGMARFCSSLCDP
uniref:Uncharacterized protein n=1 Tax=Opuntia streptacantha TaxID=393608 RepID=A0A7C9EWV6_OPUST